MSATISIFFIVLVVAFAAVVFFTEPSQTDKLIRSRLVSLDKRAVSRIEDEAGIVKEVTFSSIPFLDKFLRQNQFALQLELLIQQANLDWTVGRLAFASLSSVAVGAALGNWWIKPGLLGWAPGLIFGIVPYLYVRYMRDRRFRKVATSLPEAIDLMSRSLRAGQALPATLELLAEEIADPLGAEFRRAADEQSFGLPFRDALLNLGRRLPLPDLRFMVTAILVQKETGGNLVQILEKTSYVIRERIRVQGQARIKSAQGRMTGWILCLLPFIVFFLMNMLSPGYGRILFEHPTGQRMVAAGLCLMVVGILWIRQIVNFKV